MKAQDIQVFDTTPITSLFDRVVMASGTSNRQTRALAKSVHDKVREAGAPVLSIEGADTGEWVLVDLGDIVVHIMQPAIRDYYRLEDLWGETPIQLDEITAPFRIKSAAKKTSAKKSPAKQSAAKTPAAKTTAAKKPVAKKSPSKSPTKSPATKSPPTKSPSKKPAAKKKS